MSDRIISNAQYEFLKNELNFYNQNEFLDESQISNILSYYVIKKRISFISVLLIVGSLLIGLGILSFIASNWALMGKILKLIIIFGILFLTSFASYKLSENYPKTSRSLMYISALTYGAGIFLIGQMFHFGGHFTNAFLLWGLGILPIAVVFQDKLVFTFINILFLVYLNGYFDFENIIPWFIFIIIPSIYYLNYRFINSKLVTFFNNLILLNTIAFIMDIANFEESIVLVLFVIGVAMAFSPLKYHNDIVKTQGNIVLGIMGFIMTFDYYWYRLLNGSFIEESLLSKIFAVLFIILLIFMVKKGSITSLFFICLTILKFYFDVTYDFMPKSLFFMIGGILLVGMGIYFEKARRKIGGIGDEYQKAI